MNVNVKICTGIVAGIGAIGTVIGAYKLGESHGQDQGYIRGYNDGRIDVNSDVMRDARMIAIDTLDAAIDYVIKARAADKMKGEGQD